MPNFLFYTAPADGHFNPCRPIVKKLLSRGNKVGWITGKRYREKVERIGGTFFPWPDEIDPGDIALYDFWPELNRLTGIKQVKYYLKHIFLDTIPLLLDRLDKVLAQFPADMVIADNITFAPFIKTELGGPPSAMISLLPLSYPSIDTAPFGLGLLPHKGFMYRKRNQFLYIFFKYFLFREMGRYVNNIRTKLNLPPINYSIIEWAYQVPELVLQLTTPSFEYPRTALPDHIKFIGPVLLEPSSHVTLPPWWEDLLGDRKVILVNQGTVANNLDQLVEPVLKGLANEDVLIVAVPVKEGQLDVSAYPHVRAAPFIPFDQLLPHVDLMITNGGYGGTQLALAHGIPLIMSGATDDKMEVAARVEWSGAGINLRKLVPTPAEIRSSVQQIWADPSYIANAKRIQQDFLRYDASQLAAEHLESIVKRRNTSLSSEGWNRQSI